ncbi:hypothetical protein WPS_11620 [Vulcanimicrobium alpinum]|uniref:Uncharacterized protein n=1 Tax=Vulcanimicrobium alpinum TaxID=3016050 RepID=A0AAN1XWL1_UNVUL|nr:hypothetical protein [Vulcanimicrobium alpinum]BDE05886.1 hypothetical protein WPS_11620 [Vulcanimicrobium alpinum]
MQYRSEKELPTTMSEPETVQPNEQPAEQEYNRRRGPRRTSSGEVAADRRQNDRRTSVPGVNGLLKAIVSLEEEASETPPEA